MKVIIVGAGTGGINVARTLLEDRNVELAGFIGTPEERERFEGREVYAGLRLLGDHGLLKTLPKHEILGFVVGIGDNYLREKVFYEAMRAGLTPINAISRNAIIEPSLQLGKGVVVGPGAVACSGVSIGDNTLVGAGCVMDVNARIRENCYLFAGCNIGGEAEVGRNVTLRVGATVEPYVKVGKNREIPAGAVVSEDLPDLVRERV